MAPNVDLVTVKVFVNGKEESIKMERGTSFQNKGGIFTAGEKSGVLKMTNYQYQTFKAMANNYAEEGETGIVLSKNDILEAMNKYKKAGFVTDMSEFLPESYKIERPKLISAENMVQVYVTNGNESQSATLKFSFKNEVELNIENQVVNQVQVQHLQKEEVLSTTTKALVGADSVMVEKYTKEFKDLNANQISRRLMEQIKNGKNNVETLSMFDAIPDEKLISVVGSYNCRIDSKVITAWDDNPQDTHADARVYHTYREVDRNLFDALNNEFGVTIKDLYPRIQRLTRILEEKCPDKKDDINKLNNIAKPYLGIVDCVSYRTTTMNKIEYKLQNILNTSIVGERAWLHETKYDRNWYGIGFHRHSELHDDTQLLPGDGYRRDFIDRNLPKIWGWY